jgi:hypothetical protein
VSGGNVGDVTRVDEVGRFRVAVDADRMLEGDASRVKRNDILETSRIYNNDKKI